LVGYVNDAIIDLIDNPGSQAYGVSALPRSVAGDWLAKAWETIPIKLGPAWYRLLESEAVDAAEGGNYERLAWLLDPRHPLNDKGMAPALRTALAPSTYTLIADILSGRRKRPKRRPRLSEHERRLMNPIHDAADEVPGIQRILRAWYPKQTKKQIYDRALYVVASRRQVKLETLDVHLKRSKDDHRRAMHHTRPKVPGAERMSRTEAIMRMLSQILDRGLYLNSKQS
jgi:hypothetical protein